MARRLGVFGRFFTNFKNSFYVAKDKAKFIGQDQFGNKYYEKTGDYSHNVRPARYIEERKDFQIHDVPEVPVEWEAWLRGRRRNAPTDEEMNRNFKKMVQTKYRAAEIDQKHLQSKEAESSDGPTTTVGETVESNPKNVPWPEYEEYEIQPGLRSSKHKDKDHR